MMPNFFDQFDAAAPPPASEKAPAKPAEKPSVAADVAKSIGGGLERGVAAVPGMPGTMAQAANLPFDFLFKRLLGDEEFNRRMKKANEVRLNVSPSDVLPTSDQTVSAYERARGETYRPQTTAGKFAASAAEMVPAAIAGPGGVVSNAVRFGVLPGLAAEGAGQLTDENPLARGAAGIGTAVLGALTRRPTADAVVRSATRNVTEAELTQADHLIQEAAAQGMKLSVPEAIQHVTNGATKLGDVQRMIEGTPQGGPMMADFYRGRPAEVEGAAARTLDAVAPPVAAPSTVGPRAAEAAGRTIDDVEAAINRSTRPAYQAAEAQTIAPAEYAVISASPSYTAALDYIRKHEELGPLFAHLPDNAIGMIDAVKKLLTTRSDVPRTADATEKYLAARRGVAAKDATDAATRESPEYAYALGTQAKARDQYLEPLKSGPTGKLADAKDTKGAVSALFPSQPNAGSAQEAATAIRTVAKRDPNAARELVRVHLENSFNEATQNLQSGPNQWGGAKFSAVVAGNPQQRANLEAVISELPNGADIWKGTSRFLDVMNAMGRRLQPGSQTEPIRQMRELMTQGGKIGELATRSMGGTRLLTLAHDFYKQWRFGSASEDLARLFTDPAMLTRFRTLAGTKAGSTEASAALVYVLGRANALLRTPAKNPSLEVKEGRGNDQGGK